MLKFVYQLFLTFNSLSIFLVIYFVKIRLWIPRIGAASVIVYMVILIMMSGVGLKISHYLSPDSVDEINSIEVGSESYLSVYLGYFFVAAGLEDKDYIMLAFVFVVMFLFIFFSQAQYFNPLFLLLGYKFYGITKENGVKVFVITKRKLNGTKGVRFRALRRINDFTYIDEE